MWFSLKRRTHSIYIAPPKLSEAWNEWEIKFKVSGDFVTLNKTSETFKKETQKQSRSYVRTWFIIQEMEIEFYQ